MVAEAIGEDTLRQEMHELRLELRTGLEQIRTEMQRLRADTRGWMLAFFVPLWIGVYGTILILILKL